MNDIKVYHIINEYIKIKIKAPKRGFASEKM